jgi:predicted PurR-regulated permease PerM
MAHMTHAQPAIAKGFFLLLLAAALFLFWHLVEPYVLVLLTAGMAGVVLLPVQRLLCKKLPERLAALLIVCAVFALVFIPMLFGVVLVGKQAADLVQQSLDNRAWVAWVRDVATTLPAWAPRPDVFLAQLDIAGIAKASAGWAFTHAQTIVASTAIFAMDTLIFFMTLYYVLADRLRIVESLFALSPFDDATDRRLLSRVANTVRHVAFGALVVSAVKGLLSSIGFLLFGVPGAALWGVAVAIASQVPLVGAGIVLVPAVGYLVVGGHTAAAIGLTVWGVVLVGLADNVLSPILVGGRTNMHSLLILLSILGGLQAFGWIGFIVGPTVLAALLALLDLYREGILGTVNRG